MRLIFLCQFFFWKDRHESNTETEQEEARRNEAHGYAPFENRRGIAGRRNLRHGAFQGHGEKHYVYAVENYTGHGQKSSGEQHRWPAGQRRARKESNR